MIKFVGTWSDFKIWLRNKNNKKNEVENGKANK